MENGSYFDDDNSNPIEVTGHKLGSLDDELHNSDATKAGDSAIERLFSGLRLTSTDTARRVVWRFEPKYSQPADGKGLACVKKQKSDTSRQRRQARLCFLDSSVIEADTDPDVFVADAYELRDELRDLNEVVSTDRLATTIFDALPGEKYSTITI